MDVPVAYSTQAISNSGQQIAFLVIGFANRFFDFACSGLQVVEARHFQHPDSSDWDPRPHPGYLVCTSNAAVGLYIGSPNHEGPSRVGWPLFWKDYLALMVLL